MSLGTVQDQRMAKERNAATATVKVDPELLRMAQQVVAFAPLDAGGKPLKLSEYLDSLLRMPIERDHAKLLKRLSKEKTVEE